MAYTITDGILHSNKTIQILLPDTVTNEELFYIADCWASFVSEDLGYQPSEFLMILPDIVVH